MSANMGRVTNTADWAVPKSSSESAGMVDREICPACTKKHRGKPSARCSRIKQQMYLRGEL